MLYTLHLTCLTTRSARSKISDEKYSSLSTMHSLRMTVYSVHECYNQSALKPIQYGQDIRTLILTCSHSVYMRVTQKGRETKKPALTIDLVTIVHYKNSSWLFRTHRATRFLNSSGCSLHIFWNMYGTHIPSQNYIPLLLSSNPPTLFCCCGFV